MVGRWGDGAMGRWGGSIPNLELGSIRQGKVAGELPGSVIYDVLFQDPAVLRKVKFGKKSQNDEAHE